MKTYTVLFIALLISVATFAQEGINYKALIKDASGNPISNTLVVIQFIIYEGDALATNVYQEQHTPTTDTNGLVILSIGQGVSGDVFTDINWGNDNHFLNVQVNTGSGFVDLGTSQFRAVPYAYSSGDKLWELNDNNAIAITEKVGIGTNTPNELLSLENSNNASIQLQTNTFVDTTSIRFQNGPKTGQHSHYKIENTSDNLRFQLDTDLTATDGYEVKMSLNSLGFALENGTRINEFSTDGTLADNSNTVVPTEAAVKTYVDNATAPATPIVFKVRGNGFAVKDLDANTTIETDIWDIRTYDTRNTFNTTTKRFVVPESGYYYLHAVVRQSNSVTSSFFRISFNVDTGVDFTQIVDGDDVKTDLSGIYFLNVGQEVFVNLRNFGPSDVRIDGTGSWFEGYKIN